MERQKCKICSREFANGKALGGHMKAHMATLPLPPKTQLVVEDRESETESTKPVQKPGSPASSVSDGSPEQNVAVCLMMLSRDRWSRGRNLGIVEHRDGEYEVSKSNSNSNSKSISSESSRVRGKYRCEKCKKMFRSRQALGSHRVTHKKISGSRVYECPFCLKTFGSGQALGGHKRTHLMMGPSWTVSTNKSVVGEGSIDLNLPAPVEEDSYSVVSDPEFIR